MGLVNPPQETKNKKAIKTDPPGAFSEHQSYIDALLYQLEKYFQLQKIAKEEDCLAVVSLCLTESALHWWKATERRYTTWKEAKQFIDYYSYHYHADRSHQKILKLR